MTSARTFPPAINSLGTARRRLRRTLLAVAILVAVLLTAVAYLSYKRMTRESFLQQRFVAERFVTAVEGSFLKFVEEEELRPFDHYSFFTATTSELTRTQAFQRSPLAARNSSDDSRGLIGYFQVDPDGRFTSPLLPESEAAAIDSDSVPTILTEDERSQRAILVNQLRAIVLRASGATSLSAGHQPQETRGAADAAAGPVAGSSAPAVAPLTNGSLWEDLVLKPRAPVQERNKGVITGYDQRQLRAAEGTLNPHTSSLDGFMRSDKGFSRNKLGIQRKELSNSVDLESSAPSVARGAQGNSFNVVALEAEIDPLQARILDEEHLLLFRKAWRDGRRYLQGFVVRHRAFMEGIVREKIVESQMLRGASITFVPSGAAAFGFEYWPPASYLYGRSSSDDSRDLISEYFKSDGSPSSAGAILLYQETLRAPLDLYSILIAVERIPLPPGGGTLALVTLVLGGVIASGFFALYRLGHQHINLAQKRLDFVSAVSHELKTPLTSIRMYSEMLKSDWVSGEDKRRSYYQYIFQESERLSRLINNVLQLSRISSKSESLKLEPRTLAHVLHTLYSKVETITSSAGFILTMVESPESSSITIDVEDDALAQIAINLVENAVKFSRLVERREVQMGFERTPGSHTATFFVRDFGPGVPRSERRKIFQLFYRREDELTRQTNGTGIGLALVKELARRMHATIDYRSKEPGSEFRVSFTASSTQLNSGSQNHD